MTEELKAAYERSQELDRHYAHSLKGEFHMKAELAAAYERIAKLEADLNECHEYFEDRYDIVDGDYGAMKPNREMVLGMMIDETLNGRPF